MIRKSGLITKHAVLFLMNLIVSHPKCLVILFERLVEIIYCWNFVTRVAPIVDV